MNEAEGTEMDARLFSSVNVVISIVLAPKPPGSGKIDQGVKRRSAERKRES
jgi:hypothetical protein